MLFTAVLLGRLLFWMPTVFHEFRQYDNKPLSDAHIPAKSDFRFIHTNHFRRINRFQKCENKDRIGVRAPIIEVGVHRCGYKNYCSLAIGLIKSAAYSLEVPRPRFKER